MLGDLNLKEVKKVTHHTRSKWFHLGIELDFDVATLKVSTGNILCVQSDYYGSILDSF